MAQEPYYIRTVNYNFYNLFDYPMTPVLYGDVSVFIGKNSTSTDYHTKQTYRFTTPHYTMVQKNMDVKYSAKVIEDVDPFEPWNNNFEHLHKILHTVDVKTASIGSLKSIEVYDNSDKLINSTTFSYTDDVDAQEYQNQGVYTEGTFLLEKLRSSSQSFVHRVFRTTKRYYPNFLESITSTNSDGFQTISLNKKWDFKTGRVIAIENVNPLGVHTLTEIVPAYKVYPEMGPMNDKSNAHMVGADAATYNYLIDNSGNKLGLITASVQTWKKDWTNYRILSDGNYNDGNNEFPIWRRSSSYLYQGNETDLQTNGTLYFDETADIFDFASTSNPNWQYAGEVVRTDNFSMPLEMKDLNNIHSATKMDFYHTRKILDAGNSKYTEVAYSGVENDVVPSGTQIYADGEVRVSGASISSAHAHTGTKSVSVSSSGQKGFQYIMKSGEYDPDKNYRISIWVHSSDPGVELYYAIGGTTHVITAQTHQADDWIRMEGFIPASVLDGSLLEVGCRAATAGAKYMDDFRFQPADAGATGYVYNDRDELTFVLDNENMFTEYEYNDAGRLVKIYKETFRNGRVLISQFEENYAALVPTAPSDVEAVQDYNNGKFTISWSDNSDNEVVFRIVKSVNGLPFEDLKIVENNTESYTDPQVYYVGERVKYGVRAENNPGISAYSHSWDYNVSINAPSNVEATYNSGSGTYTVQWVDNSNNEESFSLYVSIEGAEPYLVGTTSSNRLDDELAKNEGDAIVYSVIATNASGSSQAAFSQEIFVPVLPMQPASVEVYNYGSYYESSTTYQADLSIDWIDMATDENGYYVERKMNSGSWVSISTEAADAVWYNDYYFPYTSGDVVQYRVASFNGNGQSPWSYSNVYPLPVILPASSSVYIEENGPYIDVQFDSREGQTAYIEYQDTYSGWMWAADVDASGGFTRLDKSTLGIYSGSTIKVQVAYWDNEGDNFQSDFTESNQITIYY